MCMHPDLPTLALAWECSETERDVPSLPMLFSVPEEGSAHSKLRLPLTAVSTKDRSQTVGTDERGKRIIGRGVMRTREGHHNDEELLTVPGVYCVSGTGLRALHTYLLHLTENTTGIITLHPFYR